MASKFGRKVYYMPAWKKVRQMMLDKAGYRCSRCSAVGALEVHHKKSLAEGGEPFDVENLVVLCRNCHFRQHGNPKKRAWQEYMGISNARTE